MIRSIGVGFFLAARYIRHASIWTTILVVFIMTLTFLNLVVTSGILVGLIEGSIVAFRQHYSGQVLVTNLPGKQYIERSSALVAAIEDMPEVRDVSARYIEMGTVEANYQARVNQQNVLPDQVGAELVGIDPQKEDKLTEISQFIIAGEFLEPGDEGYVVVGTEILEEYSPVEFAGFETIAGVAPGTKIRVITDNGFKDVEVKGLLESKAGPVERRVYFIDSELRKFIGRFDYNVDEIAITLRSGTTPEEVRDSLIAQGFGRYALIRTADESLGVFLEDIKNTFGILGNVIGSISLVVASITVFIVIFITAITRRRYIGILKGIGINPQAIEISYIALSVFYAVIGIGIGFAFLYGFLVPYFAQNPIDFPFSDGILAVSLAGTLVRSFLIVLATVIAGYIPAHLIVRKNALDAILGR